MRQKPCGLHSCAFQPDPALTDRETDVIRAVARDPAKQEIAAALFISVSTVKGHLTAIQHKLGARNRSEITA